jgi:hypothetical protein
LAQSNANSINASSGSEPAPIAPPKKTSAVMDDAFDLLKRYFLLLIIPSAILILPTHLILTYIELRYINPVLAELSAQGENADIVRSMGIGLAMVIIGSPTRSIPGLISIFVPLLASGASATVIADMYLGRTLSITRSMILVLRRWPTIFGITILGMLSSLLILVLSLSIMIFAAIIVVMVLSVISAMSSGALPPALIVVIGLVILLTPYFITTFFISRTFIFAVPAAMLENTGTLEAATRSQQLAKKAKMGGITALLPLVILTLQYWLSVGSSSAFHLLGLSPQFEFALSSAGGAVIVCTMQTFWMVFLSCLYLNARVQRECVDIRWLVSDGAEQV